VWGTLWVKLNQVGEYLVHVGLRVESFVIGPSNPEDEYVKVETKRSRAAAAENQGQSQRPGYGR
jgi:hypothetical protein